MGTCSFNLLLYNPNEHEVRDFGTKGRKLKVSNYKETVAPIMPRSRKLQEVNPTTGFLPFPPISMDWSPLSSGDILGRTKKKDNTFKEPPPAPSTIRAPVTSLELWQPAVVEAVSGGDLLYIYTHTVYIHIHIRTHIYIYTYTNNIHIYIYYACLVCIYIKLCRSW
ncbi:hypothetical protein LguiB_008941 [Lonicera macranthoides]